MSSALADHSKGRPTRRQVLEKDTTVSPLHAQLVYLHGEWWLADCQSEHGTFLLVEDAGSKVVRRLLPYCCPISELRRPLALMPTRAHILNRIVLRRVSALTCTAFRHQGSDRRHLSRRADRGAATRHTAAVRRAVSRTRRARWAVCTSNTAVVASQSSQRTRRLVADCSMALAAFERVRGRFSRG